MNIDALTIINPHYIDQATDMPTHAKTHEECLAVVCLLCFKKCSKDLRPINARHKDIINEHFITGYNDKDSRLPTVICATCRTVVQQYGNGNFTRNIHLFDYAKLGVQPKVTRQSNCTCIVCQIATSFVGSDGGCIGGKNSVGGRPACKESDGKKPCVLRLCSICLSEVAPGKPHSCSPLAKRLENVQSLISAGPVNSAEKVASTIIKKQLSTSSSSSSLEMLPFGGGHALKIVVASSSSPQIPQQSVFQHSAIADIQRDLSLSNRKTLKLSSHLMRSADSVINKNFIQPNLKKKLRENDHQCDDFFELQSITFIKKEKNVIVEETSRWTVMCRDVEGFIDHVKKMRNFTPGKIVFHCCILS